MQDGAGGWKTGHLGQILTHNTSDDIFYKEESMLFSNLLLNTGDPGYIKLEMVCDIIQYINNWIRKNGSS